MRVLVTEQHVEGTERTEFNAFEFDEVIGHERQPGQRCGCGFDGRGLQDEHRPWLCARIHLADHSCAVEL